MLRYHYDRADTTDPLSRIQYVDMKTYLVDDILVKVDRASMANSLEVRCPLLDHKLMELIAQMPSGLKLHNGQGKVHFQEVSGAGLAARSSDPAQEGFFDSGGGVVPRRIEGLCARRACSNARTMLLNTAFLKQCWNQHQRGQRDWSALLVVHVLMFKAWQEVYRA